MSHMSNSFHPKAHCIFFSKFWRLNRNEVLMYKTFSWKKKLVIAIIFRLLFYLVVLSELKIHTMKIYLYLCMFPWSSCIYTYKLYRYHITWIHWRYQWMVSPFPLKKAAKFLYIKNGQTNTSTLLKAKCRITPLVWRGTLINKPQWKSTENRILFTCWFVCTHSHKHAHTINKKQENTNHSIICIYKTPLFSKDLLVELM